MIEVSADTYAVVILTIKQILHIIRTTDDKDEILDKVERILLTTEKLYENEKRKELNNYGNGRSE